MRISDWSSDVCSSDLAKAAGKRQRQHGGNKGGGQPIGHRGAHNQEVSGRRTARCSGCGSRGSQWHSARRRCRAVPPPVRSEEHTSELQSLMRISYAVFCLKKKKTKTHHTTKPN